MIQIVVPTPHERNNTQLVKQMNYYVWMILKSNGIKDEEMKSRVQLLKEEPFMFVRHIIIDGVYYLTVSPCKYINPTAHFLSSESGFQHYYDNTIASQLQKIKK